MISAFYKNLLKPVLFSQDAEFVHDKFTKIGYELGNHKATQALTSLLFKYSDISLHQNINGTLFENPIGLSAGFDYNANLTQILGQVGFGFATIGTVTNSEYEGNPKPRLSRLPQEKALIVNKGFKNLGANRIINNINKLKFSLPIGISIGRTNSDKLQTIEQSIRDIVSAFKKFEKSSVSNSYYELNISCPNLINGNKLITFYPVKNLKKLLIMIDKLKVSLPVYIKMPICESDQDTLKMLKKISKHNIQGVIFGNLKKTDKGNLSGRPTFDRSNELITLTYQNFSKRFVIIGSGGVFSAEDAYEKIKRGASLVQLITGMVYEGPQLIGQINRGLVKLLEKDNYEEISEAVGSYYK